MEIRVLGPTEIHREGAGVSPGGLKQRTVLALLVAARGRPVSTDALIEGVYGDAAAAGARRTLATYVSNLRQLLGDDLTRSGDGYVLRSDGVDVDMITFETLYRDAVALVDTDPGRASAMLRDALAQWRGHAFVDVEARSMLDAEITRLDDLRLAALDARIEADLALGLHRDLIGELESLTAEHPYRESFRAHHMVALYRSGRQSEALRAFGRTRTLLAEELGIDPSPDLRELELAILSQDPKLEVRIKAAIETKAILAGELDDGVRHLSYRERDLALTARDETFAAAVAGSGGTQLGVRGMAVYAAFPDVGSAIAAARALAGGSLRLAIDHGEVEITEDDTTGPPISRALRLAAVAHPGQVLLSPDAHGRLSTERSAGWSVMSLGTFGIRGLDGPLAVFQLTGTGGPDAYPELLVDRLPPPMPHRSTTSSVPGYELRTELGGGPAGAVYRAYQASIGREVAVRVIRPEVVTDPRFIRRFEATAQRIAAISHPHLVELLDYWRDPSQAFLVYRLIEGGALADRAGAPLPIVEQVGAALAAAHDAGMPHGRVRPESIIVDREGNAYLSGLGVASILHDLVPFPADAFTAPETIGGHATVAGDVYSLGTLVATLLAGPQPADGPPASPSGPLGEVIARATHPDPALRHGDVRQLLVALADAVHGPAVPTERPARNPYKGLAAFQEADAEDFFGRTDVITALVDSMGHNRLTVVVGPSGIGKSSVVRAGLIPALRRGALPGSEDWLITDMFPGSRPFEGLEQALARISTRPPADQVDLLRSGRAGLVDVVRALVPTGATAVLVVDQFEELFTQVTDEVVRRRFLELLVEVYHAADSAVRVVATLRADFFDRPLRNAAFGDLLDDVLVTVPAPTTEELVDIVTRPGRGVGLAMEDALVTTLVADADGESGGLPLLQHALTELYETREEDALTLEAYVAAGGLSGSIGRRADAIFAGLSDEDRATAREVFVRLVTVDDNAEDTRKRVRVAELDTIGASRASIDRVLEAFGRHRLLVFDRDAATRGPTVEVAHEALIRHWERLRDWVDERREALLTHRRVELATRDWVASGRDPSFLVAGARLEHAEALGSGIGRNSEEARFLAESRRVVDAVRANRLRNRRRVTTSLSAALALAVAFGSFGWAQRGVAEREAITARMQELAVEAEAAIDEDPDLAILLALEAYELSEQLDVERTPGEVMRALHVTTQASRLVAQLPHGRFAAALSPDGELLALDDPMQREMVHVYDAQRLSLLHSFDAGGVVGALAFTPSGDELAVSFHDDWEDLDPSVFDGVPGIRLYDATTWSETRSFDDRLRGWNIGFSASGRFVVVNGYSGTGIRDESTVILEDVDFVRWVPGSDVAAVWRADREVIELFDPSDSSVTASVPVAGMVISGLEVHPDLERILIGDAVTERVLEIDLRGQIISQIESAGVQFVSYVADGAGFIAQGNDDRVLYSSGGTVMDLRGHRGGSWTTVVSSDARRVYSLMLNGGTRVWDVSVEGQQALASKPFHQDRWFPMRSTDHGRVGLVYADPDGRRLEVLDVSTGDSIRGPVIVGPSEYIDPAEGLTIKQLPADIELEVCERVLADGGSPLSVAILNECESEPFLRVVHIETGVEVRRLPDFGPLFFGPSETVGSQFLVFNSPNFGPIEIIRIADGETVGAITEPDALFVPTFSHDGRTLTVGSQQGVLTRVDLESIVDGESFDEAMVQLQDGFGTTNYTTSGAGLVVSSRSGEILRFRDRDTLDLLFDVPISTRNFVPMFITPGDRYLYYRDGRGDQTLLRRMPLQADELVSLAESLTTRDLSVEECQRFLIDTDCSVYEET